MQLCFEVGEMQCERAPSLMMVVAAEVLFYYR